MKNIFTILILLAISCSGLKKTDVSNNSEVSDEKESKYLEATVKEFKIVFFRECLSESLGTRDK